MNTNIDSKIIRHLSKDKTLKPLLENFTIAIDDQGSDVFDELIRSIVSQQLSTSAAKTIYHRFLALFEDREDMKTRLKNVPLDTLRAAGLSGQKSAYLRNVVDYFEANNLYDTDWTQWTDEAIIHTLVQIKGVGQWTAEMILMFSLHRPDVLPLDDLVIRNNIKKLYHVQSEKRQLIHDLTHIAESWRPYRSYACHYLWAAKNTAFIP